MPVGIAIIFSRPIIAQDSMAFLFLHLLGWFLFVLYVTFRVWATLYIGGRKDSELQTKGPYSVTRNPLYLGTFCFALATACFSCSISIIVAILVGCTFYTTVIKSEERYLGKIFGEDFRSYCLRTPRFFPSFSLFQSPESVNVNVGALRTEYKRLWIAMSIPVIAEILMYFRMQPWWPFLFKLP